MVLSHICSFVIDIVIYESTWIDLLWYILEVITQSFKDINDMYDQQKCAINNRHIKLMAQHQYVGSMDHGNMYAVLCINSLQLYFNVYYERWLHILFHLSIDKLCIITRKSIIAIFYANYDCCKGIFKFTRSYHNQSMELYSYIIRCIILLNTASCLLYLIGFWMHIWHIMLYIHQI